MWEKRAKLNSEKNNLNISTDFFLLISNLAQIDSKETLIRLFIEGLNSIFPGSNFEWYEKSLELKPDLNYLEVVTQQETYGRLIFSKESGLLASDLHTYLQNTVQTVAVFIERLNQKQFLKNKTDQLEDFTDNQTKKIKKQKEELKTIEKYTSDLIARFDRNYRHIYANENLSEFTSFKSSEVIGKTFRDLGFSNEVSGYWERNIRNVFQQKKGLEDYFEFHGTKGKFMFNWRLLPEFDDSGNVNSVLSILRDITMQRKLESKYQNLFSHSPIGIFTYNSKGIIQDANNKLIQILGSPSVSKTKIINVFKLPALIKSGITDDLKKSIQTGKTISNVRHYTSRWGKTLYLRYSISPLFLSGGKSSICQVIVEDFTEQKRTELELKESKEKAEQSDRLKSSFLANLSHEIRTPMNAIIGFSQLLKEKQFSPDRQKQFLDIIHQKTKSLLALIDDIIDISKIEANELKIQKKPFFINNLIFNLYDSYSLKLESSGKPIELEVEKGLNNKTGYIFSDETRIKQIFNNLLSNAIKFTNTGTIKFGYFLDKNSELVFFTKDTGVGIPEDRKNDIFNSFRQVDESSTRKFGGTGLGLAISKKLTGMMGGKIWVESTVNEGSAFYFKIPYEPVSPKNISNTMSSNEEKMTWPGQTIMIVEDDPISAEFLEEVIKLAKAKTMRSGSYNEAITKFEKHQHNIDLLLVDIRLPDQSGIELIKKIRKENISIPIITQTAYAMNENRKKSIEAGANESVTKPIEMKTLLALINKYLT